MPTSPPVLYSLYYYTNKLYRLGGTGNLYPATLYRN